MFTTWQVSIAAKVSPRTLQWWDERRVLSPIQEKHRRFYTEQDLYAALVIAAVVQRGLGLEHAKRIRKRVERENARQDIDRRGWVLTDGHDIRFLAALDYQALAAFVSVPRLQAYHVISLALIDAEMERISSGSTARKPVRSEGAFAPGIAERVERRA